MVVKAHAIDSSTITFGELVEPYQVEQLQGVRGWSYAGIELVVESHLRLTILFNEVLAEVNDLALVGKALHVCQLKVVGADHQERFEPE